jgi:hypothetical protein
MRPYHSVALLSLLLLGSISATAQSPTKARTETGKDVLLYADGTWKYAADETATAANAATGTRPSSATKKVETTRGDFVIWYDDAKWQLEKATDEDDKLTLRLRRSDGYAMILAEGLPMPIETLKGVALQNAKAAAPDSKIISEETRRVNGKEVKMLIIDGTVSGIPFRYYGYYYSGKQGTIQLITYTGQSLFEKYKLEFTNLLNGLEIKD